MTLRLKKGGKSSMKAGSSLEFLTPSCYDQKSLDPFEKVEPLEVECTLIDVPHAESTSQYEYQHEMSDIGESSSGNKRWWHRQKRIWHVELTGMLNIDMFNLLTYWLIQ